MLEGILEWDSQCYIVNLEVITDLISSKDVETNFLLTQQFLKLINILKREYLC